MLDDGLATPRRRPGDALGEEATCTSCSCGGQEIARTFGADPVVALGVVGDLLDVVGKIGQLVDDEIRAEGTDRVEKRCGVEDVAYDRLCSKGRDLGSLVVRAGHACYLVAGTHEPRHEPDADDPGRPGEEHPHHGVYSAWKLRRSSSWQTEIAYSL